MCGIVGFYNLDNSLISASDLERMRFLLAHRGPDSEGHCFLDGPARALEGAVGFGHQRLAILDLSAAGHQPMQTSDGRYSIVLNGEIYNHHEIRQELTQVDDNLRFQGTSDTETLLIAFARWGAQAVEKLNGMFAFAIYDRQEKAMSLFRDRVGIKPLYYFWDGIHLAFSSELQALTAFPYCSKQIYHYALALYLSYGYVPGPVTIFNNCYKLEPGHSLTLSPTGLTNREYWSALETYSNVSARATDYDETELINELDSLVQDSVSLRLLSDVPLGAFLSGGVDSSLIVSVMQSLSDRPVKTFTIGFRESGFDEAQHAAEVANYLGTEHHEHYFSSKDVLRIMGDAIAYSDEPFADPALMPTMLVSEFARNNVTVALTGDGGDELFWGGYRRYRLYAEWNRFVPLLRLLTNDSLRRGIATLFPRFAASRFYSLSNIDTPFMLYASLLTPFRPRDIAALVMAPDESGMAEALVRHDKLGSQFFEENASTSAIVSPYDIRNVLVDKFLTKTDRASMRVALEARVPLLDHRIVEFALSLPFSLKSRSGVNKYILKEVLKRYLPSSLWEREKHGFSVPIAQWMGTELKDHLSTYLNSEFIREQGLLDAEVVSQLVDEHLAGKYNHSRRLWFILILQMWLERHDVHVEEDVSSERMWVSR